MTVRAACYTTDSAPRGAISQHDEMEKFCSDRGWEAERHTEDHPGDSSTPPQDRPTLGAILDRLDTGGLEALVVAEAAMVARAPQDLNTLSERASRSGWRLVLLDAGVDTGTPAGKLWQVFLDAE